MFILFITLNYSTYIYKRSIFKRDLYYILVIQIYLSYNYKEKINSKFPKMLPFKLLINT